MKISTLARGPRLLAAVLASVITIGLSGCPADKRKVAKERDEAAPAAKSVQESPPKSKPRVREQPAGESAAAAKPKSPEKDLARELEQVADKPRDLGPPLVENRDKLSRLDPEQPVWLDRANHQVVLQGEVCRAGYPLEFFATYSNRSYEAVVAVNVKPSLIHAGLLAAGAVAGHPAQFQPEFVAPTGTEVAIEVRWKDADGKVQSARAQDWIRNIKTKKALDSNWVFAGSTVVTDEETGQRYYQADSGDMICVLSLPSAMLDLPLRGYGALESRSFEAFAEHLPPPGTPVTLVLKPILSAKSAVPANDRHAEAEQSAVASAEAWLALTDVGEYAQSWETAAEYWKDVVDRRDFIKLLGGVRRPLGDVKSRKIQSKQYTTSLPGAPDGQYVRIEYASSFANKKSAVETITPMRDKDKKWKVSGYYIR